MNNIKERNCNAKKVLLLTYYFAPCNYVAANRPNSFAKELNKYGYKVEVVTRHWKGTEKIWSDYLKASNDPIQIEQVDGIKIHRLGYKPTSYYKNKIFSKWQTLLRLFSGKINHDVNYYQYKTYISSLLQNQHFDLILVSVPPINALRMAAELSKKHKVDLLVDVRDFENNIILNKSLRIPFFDKVKHQIHLIQSIKWFKQATLIFTVNSPITTFIKSKTGKSAITVMNGFQEKLLNINEAGYSNFHITLIGSVYDIPEFEELLNGFKLLFQQDFSNEITVQFIGIDTSDKLFLKIKDTVPVRNLVVKDRMPQEQAQIEAAKSQLLLVLGFKNMKAVLGTKAFEYMGLRKTIIQMPGDEDVMQEIILKCRAGYCPTTANDFIQVVEKCFLEWKNTGNIAYNGDIDMIKAYTREEQFKQLLPYLEKL